VVLGSDGGRTLGPLRGRPGTGSPGLVAALLQTTCASRTQAAVCAAGKPRAVESRSREPGGVGGSPGLRRTLLRGLLLLRRRGRTWAK
jgi:hypothetical protein